MAKTMVSCNNAAMNRMQTDLNQVITANAVKTLCYALPQNVHVHRTRAIALWVSLKSSPPLGVVSVAGLLGEVLVPAGRVDVLALLQACPFGILLEVGHVM